MEYFAQITALAALAVVAFQQILKLNIVPVYLANKYPVITNIVLSAIASVVVTWKTAVTLTGWTSWVAYAGMVSVIAAVTYNMTLKNSPTVQKVSNNTGPQY